MISERRQIEDGPPMIYINCRLTKVTSPQDISQQLCRQIVNRNRDWLQALPEIFLEKILHNMKLNFRYPLESVGVKVASVTKDVLLNDILKIFEEKPDDLSATIAKLESLLEGLESQGMKPIIVIGNFI